MEMEEIRLCASRLAFSILLAAGCRVAMAQGSPNDGINRNLLQREQQSAEFHVRLYDTGRAAGQDALIPLPPIPNSFIGPELYQVPSSSPQAGTGNSGVAPGAGDRQQLNDSQLRRQLELQTQSKFLDEPTRQQQSQIQQLQFGRENQAQQLQQQIQRDSSNLIQRSR